MLLLVSADPNPTIIISIIAKHNVVLCYETISSKFREEPVYKERNAYLIWREEEGFICNGERNIWHGSDVIAVNK